MLSRLVKELEYSKIGGKKGGFFLSFFFFSLALTCNREVENATKGVKFACQQRFDTESEATEFIDDWNEAFADIWRREIKLGLKDGWRARSLDFDLASVLTKRSNEANAESDLVLRLNQLEVSKLAK